MAAPKIDEVFSNHEQHFQYSCAASGMELVLKLHRLVALDYRELQDKYRDTNIGFSKLAELKPFGIVANNKELDVDDGLDLISTEVAEGRFPLVSSTDGVAWHIWVGIGDKQVLAFRSRAFQIPNVLEKSTTDLRKELNCYRNGKIDVATYSITPPVPTVTVSTA